MTAFPHFDSTGHKHHQDDRKQRYWKVEMILVDKAGVRKAAKQVEIGPNRQLVGTIDSAELFKSYFDSNPGDFTGRGGAQSGD